MTIKKKDKRRMFYDCIVIIPSWFTLFQANRNLSQLPNFAFSVPLAYFLQLEGDDPTRADEKVRAKLRLGAFVTSL